MNNISIIGTLGRDPEIATTPNGTTIAKFSIAVNDGFGDKQKTYWFNCVAFGKTAETIQRYVTKGGKVGITGKLSQSKWDTQDGQKRSSVEIIVNIIDLLTPRNQTQGQTQQPTGQDYYQQQNQQYQDNSPVEDDEIPF